MQRRNVFVRFGLPILLIGIVLLAGVAGTISLSRTHAAASTTATQAFDRASQEIGVPMPLLQAICYMEGRLSMHGGSPSRDNGYGCMHLVQNAPFDTSERADNPVLLQHHFDLVQSNRADMLNQAAKALGVSTQLLKTDLTTNVRGGAVVLRDDALQLSSKHTLPSSLSGWYGAVAAYSDATTRSTALMYADEVYQILRSGFSATTDTGEQVTLAPQVVAADVNTAASVKGTSSLPAGCTNDGKTDYPGAIDCILNPSIYDCNVVPSNAPCTYQSANRPHDFPIKFVVIHDIEGTAQDALNTFQNPNSGVSSHYIVDSNGTIYQVVHEKDIAYHAGNFWYNQRAVGIEHAGFDATGFQWYNATEYMASAKLTAYLLKKYNIPLDRSFIPGHENIPAPFLAVAPNHVDPGPYWLWDYYFKLIHQQGVAFPNKQGAAGIITLHPPTDQHPYKKNGKETRANFNFFYLYNGPSTQSGLIPQEGSSTDITDVTDNVGPDVSYYYIDKVKDPAGTGDTMYEIWYGEEDHAHDPSPSFFADAKLAWLAVPPNTAFAGQGALVKLIGTSSNGGNAEIYGRPTTDELYHIGNAPSDSIFVSAYKVNEYQTTNRWYEINYNHRQAWVPASEVTVVQPNA